MKEDNRKERIQVTLFDKEGHYKPISTLVKVVNAEEEIKTRKQEIIKEGILNICHQRYTTWNSLKKSYQGVKIRVYKPEEIQAQQELQHKINLIKKIEKNRQKSIDK